MPVFMDSGPSFHYRQMEHLCDAKKNLDRFCKIDHNEADVKRSRMISVVSTMETMPSLSDLPGLFDIPATSKIEDAQDWEDKDPFLQDADDMDKIDTNEHILTSEFSPDEGRRCDIDFSALHDDVFSDASRSGLNDPFLGELPPEAIATRKCSFPKGLTHNDETGNMQKRRQKFSIRSSDDQQEDTILFCNRLLKMTKTKQDEEEDPEVRFLAKVSILTQIAQHGDQTQDPCTPDSNGFGGHFSIVPTFGRQVSAPVGDLNSEHSSGRHVTPPLWVDALAGLPGRALQKIAQAPDQVLDSFMPESKAFGCQVSSGPNFGRQVSAPVDARKFDHGFRRQVTAPLPSYSRSLTLKLVPVHLAVLHEAVDAEAFAGPPGRALRKASKHADQARDQFTPDSNDFGRHVSAGPSFRRHDLCASS